MTPSKRINSLLDVLRQHQDSDSNADEIVFHTVAESLAKANDGPQQPPEGLHSHKMQQPVNFQYSQMITSLRNELDIDCIELHRYSAYLEKFEPCNQEFGKMSVGEAEEMVKQRKW